MPIKRSIYTEVALEFAAKIRRLQEESTRSRAIPFMQEKVSADTFRTRFRQMEPQERVQLIQQMGTTEIMRLLDGGNPDAR